MTPIIQELRGLLVEYPGTSELLVHREALRALLECAEALDEIKTLFQFALLCTTPEIAKDGMEYVRRADAALAKLRECGK